MGLFDVTLGRQIEYYKKNGEGEAPDPDGQLAMVPDRPAIHCHQPGREIDLGGVGKGFALDRVKDLLRDWEIESGILSSGASTHLAFGSGKWAVGLSGEKAVREVFLQNQALSASGTGVQNEHIISPAGGPEAYRHPRVWVLHESAAWADIWSTAAMLMNENELQAQASELAGIYVQNAQTGAVDALTPKKKTS
jgi:thiamine biosynthesis lipoprotein